MVDSGQHPYRRDVLKGIGGATGAGMMGLAGCLGGSGGGQQQTSLVFGGGEQASQAYQMGVGLAQLVKQETDGQITISTQTSGGDEIEFRGVEDGTFDLATGTTPSFWRAGKGKDPFKKKIEVNICFTWSVIPFPLGFTTADNENINYLEDLKGKKIGTGAPGATTHFYFVSYCKANGIDTSGMQFQRVPTDEGLRLVNDGRLDAVISGASNDQPGPAVSQWLARTSKAKMVPPKKGERSIKLGEYVGGGVVWNLAVENFKQAWKNSAISDQSHVELIAGTTTLFSDLRIADDVIYQITNTAFEQREKLPDYHDLWGGFAKKPEKFAMAMNLRDAKAAPYHPGAVKAMKEHDVWNEEFPVAQRE